MKNSQKGFIIPFIIAIIALLAIGGGVYMYEKGRSQQTDTSLVSQGASLKTYTNSENSFSFQYPSYARIQVDSTNGITASFELAVLSNTEQNVNLDSVLVRIYKRSMIGGRII
jgi:hypothetical protein